MQKKWIIAGIFSLIIFDGEAKAPTSYSQLRLQLKQISQKEVVGWVSEILRVSAPSRMVGRPGHEKASLYLQDTIKSLDHKQSGKLSVNKFQPDIEEAKRFYQEDFKNKVDGKIATNHPDYIKWFNFTRHMKDRSEKMKNIPAENIVWEKLGKNTQKLLVIVAHYDTISHDPNTLFIRSDAMPGANYNASGVAVGLGLIKYLSQIDLNISVQVVFLDWQGIGFLGSYQHAQELKASGKDVIGVINLEMLGQDSSYFDKTKKTGNMSLYLRNNPEEEVFARKLLAGGQKIEQKVSFELKANNFENSDNIRYSEKDFLAVTFSQNWEDDFNPKFYQTPQDTTETLNHDTLYHSFLFIGGAVAGSVLDLTK